MTINDDHCQDQRLSIGSRLRAARERSGQTMSHYSRQLKLPLVVIESIESERWERLGAPIFVRSHLRTYAKALNVDIENDIEPLIATLSTPELVAMAPSTRLQRYIDLSSRNMAYIAGTLMLVPLVFFAATQLNKPRPMVSAPLDPPPVSELQIEPPAIQTAPLASLDTSELPIPAGAPKPQIAIPLAESADSLQPVSAALGSFPVANTTAIAGQIIEFTLADQSWVEVRNRDGRRLESSLLASGQTRRFAVDDIGSLVFGNADAVTLNVAGNPVDLTPYRYANVVRIAVSSDGQLSADGR